MVIVNLMPAKNYKEAETSKTGKRLVKGES